MRELSLEERKAYSLDILIYLDKICKKNGIRYYLAYGTLLGAVRHKGFIPWDDDVDVWVLQDDYVRLMQLLHNQKEYELLDFITGEKWYSYFSKLSNSKTMVVSNNTKAQIYRGIAVDIFPLYKCPDNTKYIAKKQKYASKLSILANYNNKQYSSIKKIVCNAMCCMGLNYKHYIDLLTKDNCDEYDNYACFGSIYKNKDIHHKELFSSAIQTEFEGYTFFAPIGYETVLHNLYGNYMILPPEERRISNHDVTVYEK